MRRHDTIEWQGRDAAGHVKPHAPVFTGNAPVNSPRQPREHIAHRDALTNLPNRFLLADRVRQAMYQSQRRGQALALAYLDLDGVKTINEIHGKTVGDELLVSVSQRMKEALREGDTLARIGGDEFVAVLVDLDEPRDSDSVLDRLVLVASDPVAVGGVVLQVSASIGVTLYPEGVVDVDLLLRHADQAFCSDTEQGSSRYQLFDLDLSFPSEN
jgi:diguanylate cyclase (GGDEF)-like protein